MTGSAILIKLRSDFAHWRNPFSLSFLETFLTPQKTTILGIFGSMCGLSESELEKIQEEIKVGVKIEELHGVFLDLTTLINLKVGGEKTPVSRQVLFKPTYTLLIFGDSELIRKIDKDLRNACYPTYAGISDMLAEVITIKVAEKIEPQIGKAKFANVSVPYKREDYEWDIINPQDLVIAPRVVKKTFCFKQNRKEKEFIDIIEGFNVWIKPSWDIEFLKVGSECFPIF